jgi:4-amino-4-deoxy-L-arabinose transferase-like glycosyltransferase
VSSVWVDRPLLLILLLGLALRVIFFQGYLGVGAAHDDVFSSKAYGIAQSWASGSPNFYEGTNDPLALRMGIILPTAMFYLLLGVGEVSMVMYPMICSLLSLLLTVQLGYLLFDRATGVLAGTLLAIFPLDVLYASVLWPDTTMCTFQLLAVFCLLKGEDRDGPLPFRPGMLFLCGLSVGFAYISKVTGLLILPPIAAYLLYKRAGVACWAYLAGGALCGFLLEGAFLWLSTGDFMMRARHINPLGWMGMEREAVPSAVDTEQLPGRILWYFPSMMLVPLNRKIVYFGVFGWFLVAGLVHLIRTRDARSYTVMTWWWLVYLSIILLPRSFSPFTLAHNVKPVYLLPIVYPTVLIVARSLLNYSKFPRQKLIILALIVLGSSSLGALHLSHYASGRNMAYNSREIARFLDAHPDVGAVYVDSGTKANLEFFLEYEDFGLAEYTEADLDLLDSGLVVVNESMLYRKQPGSFVPPQVLSPPDHWLKVKDIHNPVFEKGVFRIVEGLLNSVARGYAFVSSSGQWGTRQDRRTLKQVFEDFSRPAYIYRIQSQSGRS